jgi:alpha-tubulin suppressor-like RCC1 family protein
VVTAQPADQSATVGGSASFTVGATGFALRYQWQASTDAGATWSNAAGGTAATLSLTNLTLADSGRRVRVTVSNDGGDITSQAATLTVSPAPSAPAITQQPQDSVALVGATATFSVTATGNPAPTFQWERSTDGGATFSSVPGAVGSTLTTPVLMLTDNNSRYRVVLTNPQGSVTSRSATLAVTAPPSATVRSVSLFVNTTSCAGRSDASLACWGSNASGEVTGDRFTGSWYGRPLAVPGVTGVISVAGGGGHVCAVRSGGSLMCWGGNFAGQMGLGAAAVNSFFSTPPTVVPGLSGAVEVATGFGFTCARRADGTVSCWGNNTVGQIGDGSTTQRPSPVAVPSLTGVVDIAAGQAHACALKSDGTVVCWGLNRSGSLGDGTTTNRLSPVSVSGLTNATAISAGGGNGAEHTCALRADRTVVCWGSSSSGQTGAVGDALVPRVVAGITDAVAIATGNTHSCALRASGAVVCWGSNLGGSLGAGSGLGAIVSTVPVPVSGLSGVAAIAAGAGSTCAARADGSVSCWGSNANGQLGDGTLTSRSVPTQVQGLTIELR